MERVIYVENKTKGSLTLIALGFLLLISGLLSYQISIYHSKIAVNQSLIREYQAKRSLHSKRRRK